VCRNQPADDWRVEAIGKSMMRARETDPMSGFPAGRPLIPEFPGVPGLAENRMKQISQQPRESARYSSLRSSNGHNTAAATRSSSSPWSMGTAPMPFYGRLGFEAMARGFRRFA